jgi:hypothetical protein
MNASLPFCWLFLSILFFPLLQQAQAQQNIFSIPNAEVTEAKKLFFNSSST